MNHKTITTLEFDLIQELLASFALSHAAKEQALSLAPILSEGQCRRKMDETTEARRILEGLGNPPLTSMTGIEKILELTRKGAMLIPEQLMAVTDFIRACKRMRQYLKKAETFGDAISSCGGALGDFSALYEAIDRTIQNGVVIDGASPALRDIRGKMERGNAQIKEKLDSILRGKKDWFSDGFVTMRNGRFVLSVKKQYKSQVAGTVIDTSGTGGTCFIEPSAVRKLQEDLSVLRIEEDQEIRKILYTLTVLVDEQAPVLKISMDCLTALDFIFAKAKLSASMKAVPVPVTAERRITLRQGRHPLLKPDACVPLDFEIGGDVSGIVITGPNTGGKTVALKTVGLLSLMAQSGLHIPAGEGSALCMHGSILCDIGDGQSIAQNLSTFSSHITNIISILGAVSDESLVLLDELGSGTDPAEGMGLAVAILEELRQKGCLFVATTHYPEIKEYARNTERLTNARMEFDRESLQPLYRLRIGEAGESCALYIAKRLGLPGHMLERAHDEAYCHPSGEKRAAPPAPDFSGNPSIPETRAARIQKEAPSAAPAENGTFGIGDSVTVLPQKEIGIVYRLCNEKGELGVQVKGEKRLVNHKRIKLLTPASELYPADYDFSIVFDSVENRKARHKMEKKHQPGLTATCEEPRG